MDCARVVKYAAIASAIAVGGFFFSIGLFTFIFDRPWGKFAPSTSADAAGWVQAIGSIVAIVAAYFYGADQARRASESALKLYRLDKARTEEGCRAIVLRLQGEVSILRRESEGRNAREFRDAWNRLRAPLNAALQAFDNMPLHEVGGWEAVLLACEIRSTVVLMREMVDSHIARWYPHEQIGDTPLDDVRENVINEAHISLRNQIATSNQRAVQLYTDFDQTKMA